MRLQSVARAFNNTECFDAYSGALAFEGQFNLYDDTKRDSETAERRILSVAPEASLPERLVVEAAGTHWIIGHANPDTFRGRVIRVGHVVHEATALATVRSLVQFCDNAAGVQAYAGRAWVKDIGFSEQSSTLAGQHHIHLARTETVEAGHVIDFDGRFYIVRASNFGAGGTLVVMAEQMASPVIEAAVVTTGTYDQITETWSGSNSTVRMIRMRWQSLFEYRSNLAPKFGPEDIQLAVSKTLLTPVAGQPVTLSDGTWQIASVLDEGVWLCRATRHE